MRKTVSGLMLLALLASTPFVAQAKRGMRIDATSVESTNSSFERMVQKLPRRKAEKVIAAMLLINLEGVKSMYDVVGDPNLHNLSAARIKDRIGGMTADEIIALADSLETPTVESVTIESSR